MGNIDIDSLELLLRMNNIDYRESVIYDESNNKFIGVWLDNGHIEFDEKGNINNIVTF